MTANRNQATLRINYSLVLRSSYLGHVSAIDQRPKKVQRQTGGRDTCLSLSALPYDLLIDLLLCTKEAWRTGDDSADKQAWAGKKDQLPCTLETYCHSRRLLRSHSGSPRPTVDRQTQKNPPKPEDRASRQQVSKIAPLAPGESHARLIRSSERRLGIKGSGHQGERGRGRVHGLERGESDPLGFGYDPAVNYPYCRSA